MKKLPEPGMACYDNNQLSNMIAEAAEELANRGWFVEWIIRAPAKKHPQSVLEVYRDGPPLETEQADSDLAIASALEYPYQLTDPEAQNGAD